MTTHRYLLHHGAAALLATGLITGCSTVTAAPEPATSPELQHVRTLLDSLPVKGRAPQIGYSRAQFGPAWSDDVTVAGGHDGCDTRNNILARDLTGEIFKPGTRDCTVLTGILDDPYTGKVIHFVRGTRTSDEVQIDHVVALSDAWQKGAQQLSPERRRDLANDPLNLLAVDGPTNQAKGDRDAASWLPPNKPFRCTYIALQIEVKSTYGLSITEAEKAAMTQQISEC